MKLKSVTIAAAIAQVAATLVMIASYVYELQSLKWSDNWRYLASAPVWIIAHATFALFLITLATRQKGQRG